MTHAQLLDIIRNSPDASDWVEVEGSDHPQTAVYEPDIALTLANGQTEAKAFNESWATGFPDPSAESFWVEFTYSGVVVEREMMVSVDGGRVAIPMPEATAIDDGPEYEWNLTANDYNFGQLYASLFGDLGRYEEYVERAGLGVPDRHAAKRFPSNRSNASSN